MVTGAQEARATAKSVRCGRIILRARCIRNAMAAHSLPSEHRSGSIRRFSGFWMTGEFRALTFSMCSDLPSCRGTR